MSTRNRSEGLRLVGSPTSSEGIKETIKRVRGIDVKTVAAVIEEADLARNNPGLRSDELISRVSETREQLTEITDVLGRLQKEIDPDFVAATEDQATESTKLTTRDEFPNIANVAPEKVAIIEKIHNSAYRDQLTKAVNALSVESLQQLRKVEEIFEYVYEQRSDPETKGMDFMRSMNSPKIIMSIGEILIEKARKLLETEPGKLFGDAKPQLEWLKEQLAFIKQHSGKISSANRPTENGEPAFFEDLMDRLKVLVKCYQEDGIATNDIRSSHKFMRIFTVKGSQSLPPVIADAIHDCSLEGNMAKLISRIPDLESWLNSNEPIEEKKVALKNFVVAIKNMVGFIDEVDGPTLNKLFMQMRDPVTRENMAKYDEQDWRKAIALVKKQNA